MPWTADSLLDHVACHMAEGRAAHRSAMTWHGQYDFWTIGRTGDGREVAACIDPPLRSDDNERRHYTTIVWNVRNGDAWEVSGTYKHEVGRMAAILEERGVTSVAPDRVGKHLEAIRTAAELIEEPGERAMFLQTLQTEIEAIPGAQVAFVTRSPIDYVDDDLPLERAQDMLGAAADSHASEDPGFDAAAEAIFEVIDTYRTSADIEP